MVNGNLDRVRTYYLKSSMTNPGEGTENSDFSNMSDNETINETVKKIKIFDRFDVIINIFAKRTSMKIAQLQIELAWLKNVKSKISRGGKFGSGMVLSLFRGDLFK